MGAASEVAAMRARVEAATEGPWFVFPHTSDGGTVEFYAVGADEDDLHTMDTDPYHETDADFIAHAREDMPRLIAFTEAVTAWAADMVKYESPRRGAVAGVVLRLAEQHLGGK